VLVRRRSVGTQARGPWRGKGGRGSRSFLGSTCPSGVQGLHGGLGVRIRLGGARHGGIVGVLSLLSEVLRLGCSSIRRLLVGAKGKDVGQDGAGA